MLSLEIISPKAQIVSTEAFEVVLPTESGEVGILSHHIPLITHLKMGVLSIFNNGVAECYAISGGYAQVKADKVSVLTDDALRVEELNVSDIEAKIKELEAQSSDTSTEEAQKRESSQLAFLKLQRSLIAHS